MNSTLGACSVLLLGLLQFGSAFITTSPAWGVLPTTTDARIGRSSIVTLSGAALSDIEDIGYYASVKKPLGVVFGENNEPYLGLRVDDIEMGSEGEMAGLRVGDQLLAVNSDVAIGDSFDSAMSLLQSAPTKMELLFYRGSVRDLYRILDKRGIEINSNAGDGSEAVIMDENYESPVRVEVKEDQGFDVMKAFSRLAGGGGDRKESKGTSEPIEEKKEAKKGGGIFGMFSQETIQLEGDDATGTGR